MPRSCCSCTGTAAAGLSVTEISTAIHGDPDHAVAIRAELSRLRRILGSVIDSRPYRISAAVEFTVELGDTLTDDAFRRGAGASPEKDAFRGRPQG
ncbi:hypothetical protein ACFYU5_18320 [Nocardia aobensis]|uniref:Uncharacterized protein n=1 Tax=Nocardia aobensis TaxID=257277 RepID=A0ABW6P4Z4_9NOCA